MLTDTLLEDYRSSFQKYLLVGRMRRNDQADKRIWF